MFKLILISLICLRCLTALANQEPEKSISELSSESTLIADGRVVSLEDIATEQLPPQHDNPITLTRRRAIFTVISILKGELPPGTRTLYIDHRSTADKRYKGLIINDLYVGQEFRLFAESVTLGKNGQFTVFVHSANSIRPEAFGTDALHASRSLQEPPDNSVKSSETNSALHDAPLLKSLSANSTARTEAPHSHGRSPTWHLIWVLLAALALIGVLIWRHRSHK